MTDSDNLSQQINHDPRKTMWTVQDHVKDIEENFPESDPDDFIYYITYSSVYHTTPDCPYIQNSESVHCASYPGALSEVYCTGFEGAVYGLDCCSWCLENAGDWS